MEVHRRDAINGDNPAKHAGRLNRKWTGLRYDQGTGFVQTDAPYIPTPGIEQIACAGKRAKATVNAGATFQINPGATTGKQVKSSKKKVATVINGVVTFRKKGSVTITCTAMRGKKKAKIKFNVGS